ncbi:MAG: DNA gyrase subunit B, partial [Methylocella sp.]
RQMRELIERGHLYIAQPPLYKVKRGGSEQYLKDERTREDYLIGNGLEAAVLRLASGEARAGADLRAIVEEARTVRQMLGGLHSRYDRQTVEQAAIAGALKPMSPGSEAEAMGFATAIAARLDERAEDMERGWSGAVENGGYVFTRELRGVRQAASLDAGLLASIEARRLNEHAQSLGEVFARPALFLRRGDRAQVAGPGDLLDAVMAAGQKGITQMQRYKGLGEMNADQLWETTLDRDARTLLQVRIREGDEAEDLFVKLMGDIVEPRREFIQDNALSVANLDV